MRLAPRTPRGTWLVATAVWIAGVAAVEAVLPVVPRATWPLPAPGHLLGFADGGRTLVTSAYVQPGPLCCFGPLPGIWDSVPSPPVRFWDVASGAECQPAWAGEAWLGDARVSPAGHMLRPAGWHHRWNDVVSVPAGGPAVRVPDHAAALAGAAAVPPADRWLVYAPASDRYRLRVWDLHARREAGALPAGEVGVFRSADGRFVGTYAVAASAARVWDLDTLRPAATVPLPADHHPYDMAVSADGRVVAVATAGAANLGAVRVFDTAGGREVFDAGPADALALTPDGRTLITAGYSSASGGTDLTLWDVTTCRPRADHRITDTPRSLRLDRCLSPDGRWLVAGLGGPRSHPLNRIAEWLGLGRPFPEPRDYTGILDVRTGRWAGELPTYLGTVAWAADGRTVATTDEAGGQVQLWDVPPHPPGSRLATAAAGLGLFTAALVGLHHRRLRRQNAAEASS
jgi:hypothetical protein